MTTLPPNPAIAHFVKPTLETRFHIDYDWWDQQALDLNVKLLGHLCAEHREAYAGQDVSEKIDWIDWNTGEVEQVDGLRYIIATHCSKQTGYIKEAATLVESIFRVFLSNGNKPLTSKELSAFVGRMPEHILRVLSGSRVRNGLRPVLEL